MNHIQKNFYPVLISKFLGIDISNFANGVEKQYNSPNWNIIKDMFLAAQEVLDEADDDNDQHKV